MRQEALHVFKEADSLAEITELPVNMTEHGSQINNARDLSSTVLLCCVVGVCFVVGILFACLWGFFLMILETGYQCCLECLLLYCIYSNCHVFIV